MKRTYGLGQFDVLDPLTIPEGGVQRAINVEYKENYLEQRTDPDEFNSQLTAYIISIITIITKIWVWYPPRMPKNATGDEIYVVFNGSDLYFFYAVSGGFGNHKIDITGVIYTSASIIRMTPGKDKLKIVDGINRPHYAKIDDDGNIIDGKLGYIPPTSKAIIEGMTVWDGSKFQEAAESAYSSEICIIEICYAYKDKFGNISNISPISAFMADYQWFEIDSDLIDTRWIKSFTYSGLQLPDGLDTDAKDVIDEFVIYRRISRFSESGEPSQFRRSMEVNIADKDSNATGNIYTDTNLTDNSASTPDYNNDVPPIAHYIEEVDTVTVYGDVEENLTFPFNFKWYSEIIINNPNSFSYIGGAVRLSLREEIFDNFTVNDYIVGGVLTNTQHLRIIDTDINTMLPVIVETWDIGTGNRDGYINILIYLPQLIKSRSDKLYFVFTDSANMGNFEGVSGKYNSGSGSSSYGYLHGRFCTLPAWDRQQTLFPIRCKSEKNIVCSPMNEYLWADSNDVPNRANTENNGTMSGGAMWKQNGNIAFPYLFSDKIIGGDCIEFDDSYVNGVDFGNIYGDDDDTVATSKLYINFNILDLHEYDDGSAHARYLNNITGNYGKAADATMKGWSLVIRKDGTTIKPVLVYRSKSANKPKQKEFNNYVISKKGNITLFIKISVDFNNQKAHLFMVDNTGQVFCDEEIDDLHDDFDSSQHEKEHIVIGDYSDPGYSTTLLYMYGIKSAKYDQFDFYKETYINNDQNICEDLASFMPYWDVQHVGWNGSTHDNITLKDVKSNELKRKKNKVVWTPENGENIPATNEKYLSNPITGLIYAKSFLQFQYGVSALIPTKNSMNRFVMEGDASGWAAKKNMIKEYEQYGKLSEDIVSMGDAYYYGSEVGAMRWSPSGMRIISNVKINGIWVPRINIIIKSTTKVIPIPVRRQVLYYNNDDQQGWLYHENGDRWTEFNSLNIESFATLTKGDRLDNKTLFLDSNIIKSYPGNNYTSADHSVLTKQYELDNNKLRKIRSDFEGSCNIITTVINNSDIGDINNGHLSFFQPAPGHNHITTSDLNFTTMGLITGIKFSISNTVINNNVFTVLEGFENLLIVEETVVEEQNVYALITIIKNNNENISKMAWYNMVSGSWGYMYQHIITRFTTLKAVYDEIIRR